MRNKISRVSSPPNSIFDADGSRSLVTAEAGGQTPSSVQVNYQKNSEISTNGDLSGLSEEGTSWRILLCFVLSCGAFITQEKQNKRKTSKNHAAKLSQVEDQGRAAGPLAGAET